MVYIHMMFRIYEQVKMRCNQGLSVRCQQVATKIQGKVGIVMDMLMLLQFRAVGKTTSMW